MELRIAVDLGRHAVTTAATRIPAHGHPVTTSTPTLAWVGPQGTVRCGVQAQVAARRDPAGVVEGWVERLFSVRVLSVDEEDGLSWRAADLLARLVEDPLRVSVLGLGARPDEVTLVEVLLVVPHGWIEAQTRAAERILAEEVETLCPAAEVDVLTVPAARALASRLPGERSGEDALGEGAAAGAGAALVLDVGAQATTLHLIDEHGDPVRTERLPGLGGDRLDDRLLAVVTERAGGVGPDGGEGSARLRSAVADAREQLSSQEAVDIPVEKGPAEREHVGEGEPQTGGQAAGAVALVQLTRHELTALVEEDLVELVAAARDLTDPVLPGRVLLVGGVAATPSLLRIVETGLAPDGGGPPPAVLRDPSPSLAAVLGALSLAESQDRAWWSGAPTEVVGAAAAGGRDRRPLLATAGAVAVLLVGALAVAALQLGGDEDPPGGTDPPPTGVTSTSRTSGGPSTTGPAVATSGPTARPSSATTDRSTATSSPTSDLPSIPPAEPDPVGPTDPDPPVLPSPVLPAPLPPAPVPPAPVPPVPAPPAPVPTATETVPVPPEPTPPPTQPTPPPTEPDPTPPPTQPTPPPTEPDPTPPPTQPTPPPTEPGPTPPPTAPAPVPPPTTPPTAPPTVPPDTEPAP